MMQFLHRRQFVIGLLGAMSLAGNVADNKQATIIDTGSTNRPGLQITMDANGIGRMKAGGAQPRAMRFDPALCKRFLLAVQDAVPLPDLPAAGCMKSASFGSRLFIEYNGQRSPDISCPGQSDPKVEDLQKQATELLGTARTASRSK